MRRWPALALWKPKRDSERWEVWEYTNAGQRRIWVGDSYDVGRGIVENENR